MEIEDNQITHANKHKAIVLKDHLSDYFDHIEQLFKIYKKAKKII